MRFIFSLPLILFVSMTALASDKYTVFSGGGDVSSLERIIASAADNDVVFLGESHDDKVAHAIQLEVFKKLHDKYGATRELVLSMEMFERDVQVVLDEYLSGVITESHFLKSSRPWQNYQQDYRPLVEFAKEKKLRVIAANAPRRYVNLVFRKGSKSLGGLSDEAGKWIAPLPYKKASKAYLERFAITFGMQSDHSAVSADSPMIEAQSLWDATMAESIVRAISTAKGKKPLVVHLNGSFHTAARLGIPEHLVAYRSETKFQVVTMKYVEDFKKLEEKDKGLGDFVVLTDAAEPRSYK